MQVLTLSMTEIWKCGSLLCLFPTNPTLASPVVAMVMRHSCFNRVITLLV